MQNNGTWQLRLPARVQDSLRRYEATFRPWRTAEYIKHIRQNFGFSAQQLPFAVVGDFNGDKLKDLVVEGRTRDSRVRLGLVSPHYRVVELERLPLSARPESYEVPTARGNERQTGRWVYLFHQAPGVLDRPEGPLKMPHDGFGVNYFMKSSLFYQFHEGKFREVYNAD